MKITRPIFLAVLVIIGLISYIGLARHQVDPGFYYWKSTLNITSDDCRTLERLRIKALYLKFFDVVWNPQAKSAVPVSTLRMAKRLPSGIEPVPTVFITNETLINSNSSDMVSLARRIRNKIMQMAKSAQLGSLREIQLDCDWTTGTRQKYFALIRAFRTGLPPDIRLSATIRLHQVKYLAETGVPPVERGMLMFYNLESPSDPNVRNSIFNLKNGQSYLTNLHAYPLPLDIALPIYSWGSVFQGDRFIGLIANLSHDELIKRPDLFRRQGRFFVAKRNSWFRNTYIYKNDRIRVDEISTEENVRAARFLAGKIRNRNLRVVIFHYDHELLRRAGLENIAAIYRSAR